MVVIEFLLKDTFVLKLPELDLLHSAGSASGSLVRIPPADSVPLSRRVRDVLDSAPMRRLAGISQLGMVSLVYPGAMHSRLEHSLGVYQQSLRVLARFQNDAVVGPWIDRGSADAFLLAALLHDIGHWPFCHPIEDMQLEELPRHETRVLGLIESGELAECIERDWQCEPEDVMDLLCLDHDSDEGLQRPAGRRFLASCLSGPIDIDKLDYLQRDSLHCGVPYGRNFDADRLVHSFVADPSTQKLAIGEKGRTAAEMMVFARYIMFSEVYWHHAVRSATAMLQRSVFLLHHRLDLASTLKLGDAQWIAKLRRTAEGSLAEPLVEGLFGPRRRLFKRVAEFNMVSGEQIHCALARRPYWWLVALCETLAEKITQATGVAVAPADLLLDAPPVKLEVDINTTVCSKDGRVDTLGDVSPVVAVLAREQFDNHTKRVRVFVRPELRDQLREHLPTIQDWSDQLTRAIEQADKEWA